jgi:hypothetical protein
MSAAAPEAQSTSASSGCPDVRRRHDVWAACRRVTTCFDLRAGIEISAAPLPSGGVRLDSLVPPPYTLCIEHM